MTAEVGKAAPDFTLKDQAGNDVTLSSFKGKSAVALHFYPFTFTGVCEGELCRIRDDYSEFEQAGVQVLAVSCDSRHSQRVWEVRSVQRATGLRDPRHVLDRQEGHRCR